ncbi:MAG: hypothetical protein IPH45_06570 [Bacteroidales bacterium]|nr:hypothetical protein [Bacteroidales bacterium]
MAHHEAEVNLSPEESKFRDFMLWGDDFYKIEIFRSARTWYERALEQDNRSEKARKKIEACNQQLAYEKKVFLILGIIAAVALILFIAL